MPDLGNYSRSALFTCCPNVKLTADVPDLSLVSPFYASVETLTNDSSRSFEPSNCDKVEAGDGVMPCIVKRTKGSSDRPKKPANGMGLENHVKDWVRKKMKSGVPESRCFLPFLNRAPKMVECVVCHTITFPEEQVKCSVNGCQVVYHAVCAKRSPAVSNLKNFKCPQHGCFICNQPFHWRCIRCTIASHDKCAPWSDTVRRLEKQRSICWRHPTDWRLDGEMQEASPHLILMPWIMESWLTGLYLLNEQHTSSTSNIEEVFCRLPLPYIHEEFNIDVTWKFMDNKIEPSAYTHIKRNIYLVKKKRDGIGDGMGCTTCSSSCSKDCMCRVQCISCSKACHCNESCKNRPFRKDKKIKIVKTALCGWGVESGECIDKGDFIIEYIGEVIDDALCEQRLWDMKHKGVKNFYMCEIRKDFTIDASFKGNASRFVNHSCNPNCILEKWQVEGETRVGLFATRSIENGEPLTYDYRFVQFGAEVECHCGAPNCHGYLGAKRKINNLNLSWGAKRRRNSTACLEITTLNSVQKKIVRSH